MSKMKEPTPELIEQLADVAKESLYTPEAKELVLEVLDCYANSAEVDVLLKKVFMLLSEVASTAVSEATKTILGDEMTSELTRAAYEIEQQKIEDELQAMLRESE